MVPVAQRSDADEDSPSTELSTLIDDLMPVKYGLSAKGVSRLFPFHVAFDKECNIVQAGAVRGDPDILFFLLFIK